MSDLRRFGLAETFALTAALPDAVKGSSSLEEAAGIAADLCYKNLVEKDTDTANLALAQCYIARPSHYSPGQSPSAACSPRRDSDRHRRTWRAALAGVAGDKRVLNDQTLRRNHHVFHLPGGARGCEQVVAELIERVSGESHQNDPTAFVHSIDGASGLAVAYVDDARHRAMGDGDALIISHGIRSLLALAARLTDETVVALVLFAKVRVPPETADAFAPVAAALKLAMVRVESEIWLADCTQTMTASRERELLRAENDALRDLLRLRRDVAVEESSRLEQALDLSRRRAAELAASQSALASSEARESSVVESALDAVIIMGGDGRVVEWNPSAEVIFGYPRSDAIGAVLGDLIIPDHLRDHHNRGLERYLRTGEARILGRRIETTAMRKDGTLLPVELAITPVKRTAGQPRLFTGTLRDISSREEDKAALLESREKFANIAHTLQRSLLPPALPQLSGVEMGSVFRPAQVGGDVGGDFYDAFRLGRTDLLLALGDVCGKGPEAAAITAIARHTIRAVAPEFRHPSQILRRLNDVMLQHDIGERFCSAVVARMVPIVHGVRLAVCCAGHPPPVVVRANGRIERVGLPGSLLGLFPDVRLLEETVQLRNGDTLVAFTDGVTDATRSGEQFGDERLELALADVRGVTAQEVADHLLEQVLDFGGTQSRDDIAIVALQPVSDG